MYSIIYYTRGSVGVLDLFLGIFSGELHIMGVMWDDMKFSWIGN
jgi:hypothetical protein